MGNPMGKILGSKGWLYRGWLYRGMDLDPEFGTNLDREINARLLTACARDQAAEGSALKDRP